MTRGEPAQQKEYIISHELAVKIWEHLRDNTHGNASYFWGKIETCRPYNPAAEREKVLDAFKSGYIQGHNDTVEGNVRVVNQAVDEYMEELRQQEE